MRHRGVRRSLAERCERVAAIDLSPRMVEVARSRSGGRQNVEYLLADANPREFFEERFGWMASITTLHHLPLAPALRKMRDALRPGGTLPVLDIYRARSAADYLAGALGFPASQVLKLAKTGSLANRRSPALRRAWEEHGRTDLFPALFRVRRVRDSELSGAEVRRRPLWRYALVWRKPAS